jgi:uncharacterized protein
MRALPRLSVLAVLLAASCATLPPKPEAISADEAIRRAVAALAAGHTQAAVDNYLIAKNLGDHRGELGIGEMYAQGRGEVQDFTEASQWLQPAADAGLAEAQYQLGLIADEGGTGVMQDRRRSFALFSKAAGQGHTLAALHLGLAYRYGRGTPVDEKEAMHWFAVAADKGNSEAMTQIGILYAQGRGVAQNDAMAQQYFDKATALGNAEAMRQIANMYLEGNGEPQSDAQGYAWLKRAADAGSEDAARRLATHIESND